MTGTDFWKMGSMTDRSEGNFLVAAGTSEDQRNKEVASMFAELMQRTSNLENPITTTVSNDSLKTESSSASYEYEVNQYKERPVTDAKEDSFASKLEETKEVKNQFDNDVVEAVAEELGLDVADVEKAMEALKITAIDLLNPEVLGELMMNLTGETDGTALLVNESFLNLFTEIGELGKVFTDEIGMEPQKYQELMEQMDVLEKPVGLTEVRPQEKVEMPKADAFITSIYGNEDKAMKNIGLENAKGDTKGLPVENAQIMEQNPDVDTQIMKQNSDADTVVLEEQNQEPEMEVVTKEFLEQESSQEQEEAAHDEFSNDRQAAGRETTPSVNQDPMIATMDVNGAADVDYTPAPEVPTYTTMDTSQIIQQIVDHVKVTFEAAATTMEMQLNPENLGKVYLQITAKEGGITAQLTAQNEAVKEALQIQVAELQDRLAQTGVKVDAIEVTVASHEFERNLEQNQHQEEERAREQEERSSGRRNLNLQSLDELSGLMTEEEVLAAQIMKDNGNSVDLTA